VNDLRVKGLGLGGLGFTRREWRARAMMHEARRSIVPLLRSPYVSIQLLGKVSRLDTTGTVLHNQHMFRYSSWAKFPD
jgi:hypothetical protein